MSDLKNYLLQGVCNVLKRIAGSCPSGDIKSDICYQDGEQLLCMDGIYKAMQNQTCLVYSFGLSDDWNFEVFMAELGLYNFILIFYFKKK